MAFAMRIIVLIQVSNDYSNPWPEVASCVSDVKSAFLKAYVTQGFSLYGHEWRTGKAKESHVEIKCYLIIRQLQAKWYKNLQEKIMKLIEGYRR